MGNVVGRDLTRPYSAGRGPLERMAAGDLDFPSMLLTTTVALLTGLVGRVAGYRRGEAARLIAMYFSDGRTHITQEETHDGPDRDIPRPLAV